MVKGLNRMMKEAQKLEGRLARVRDNLRDMSVEGTSGGAAVRVVMNGQHDVLKVMIDPGVLEGADAEMLEDLLLSAIRDARAKADELAQAEISKAAGGLVPPGMT